MWYEGTGARGQGEEMRDRNKSKVSGNRMVTFLIETGNSEGPLNLHRQLSCSQVVIVRGGELSNSLTYRTVPGIWGNLHKILDARGSGEVWVSKCLALPVIWEVLHKLPGARGTTIARAFLILHAPSSEMVVDCFCEVISWQTSAWCLSIVE